MNRRLGRRALLAAAPLPWLAACSPTPTSTGAAPSPADRATAAGSGPTATGTTAGWSMPDEGSRHARTWMAFGPSADIWGAELVPVVRRNLADVANAIVAYEPVTMLVRPGEEGAARKLLDPAVDLLPLDIDDLWVRDTGATFVRSAATLGGVDFNFNGWGGKQDHAADAKVAAAIAEEADATVVSTKLTLEGGALEVDGEGTAIITESCVLNPNRNPGWTKPQVEAELARTIGVRKVIWLPGIPGHDITDGHTDFYARFVRPGQVVAALDTDPASFDHTVTRTHLAILNEATDAAGRRLAVTTLTAPTNLRYADAGDDFAAGYINFYVCNGAVIAPQFGDRDADAAAGSTLCDLFPDRKVIQLNIDGIAAGGGGIHCSTQQQPAEA